MQSIQIFLQATPSFSSQININTKNKKSTDTCTYLSNGSWCDSPEREVGGGARSGHGVCLPCPRLAIGHDGGIVAIQRPGDQLSATATVHILLTGIVEDLQNTCIYDVWQSQVEIEDYSAFNWLNSISSPTDML